jgi:hypothetical protein
MWKSEKEIERKEETREDCMEKGGLKRREKTICRKGWTLCTDDRTKWRRGRTVLRKGRCMQRGQNEEGEKWCMGKRGE